MKRRLLLASPLLAALSLSSGPARAWSPSYPEKKDSPLLQELGLVIRSEWQKGTETVLCEVLFDERFKARPAISRASLLVATDLGLTHLFQSDHHLGHFVSYTEPTFGTGGGVSIQRFGFRFYLNPKYVKEAMILLELDASKLKGKFSSGEHTLRLEDYLPPYPP